MEHGDVPFYVFTLLLYFVQMHQTAIEGRCLYDKNSYNISDLFSAIFRMCSEHVPCAGAQAT